jgi:hypothetical protein
MATITITFGDVCENHVGMEKLGELSDRGFSVDVLKAAKSKFADRGYECELVDLATADIPDVLDVPNVPNVPEAYVLVVRNGVSALTGTDGTVGTAELHSELSSLKWDTKAKMYGRIVNKHARYNLCFADEGHEPDYAEGKGRVVSFGDVPALSHVRERLVEFVGPEAANLCAEGNYYYDVKKCGIGYHGDSERRKVIALRLGSPMMICYQWFHSKKPVGKRIEIKLNGGDFYIMSEKAVGNDWKRSVIPTLRHAAGCEKYCKQVV